MSEVATEEQPSYVDPGNVCVSPLAGKSNLSGGVSEAIKLKRRRILQREIDMLREQQIQSARESVSRVRASEGETKRRISVVMDKRLKGIQALKKALEEEREAAKKAREEEGRRRADQVRATRASTPPRSSLLKKLEDERKKGSAVLRAETAELLAKSRAAMEESKKVALEKRKHVEEDPTNKKDLDLRREQRAREIEALRKTLEEERKAIQKAREEEGRLKADQVRRIRAGERVSSESTFSDRVAEKKQQHARLRAEIVELLAKSRAAMKEEESKVLMQKRKHVEEDPVNKKDLDLRREQRAKEIEALRKTLEEEREAAKKAREEEGRRRADQVRATRASTPPRSSLLKKLEDERKKGSAVLRAETAELLAKSRAAMEESKKVALEKRKHVEEDPTNKKDLDLRREQRAREIEALRKTLEEERKAIQKAREEEGRLKADQVRQSRCLSKLRRSEVLKEMEAKRKKAQEGIWEVVE
uniref:Putative Trichohyalin n=1 Tax=Trypanosoma vivax (strain Y486) TaxID=1055687 RepID=G0UD56_TRYVY|nr:putative Trichohyalin [Trypanosoma vivax Y486]